MPRPRPRLIPVAAGVLGLAATAAAWTGGEEPPKPPVNAATAEPAAKEEPAKKREAPAPVKTEKVSDLAPEERAKRLLAAERELARNLGGLRTLRADFVQRKHLDVFDGDVESRGTLFLQVPGKLRWEFSSPVKSVLVVDGARGRRERTSRRGVKTEERFVLAEDPVAAGTAGQVFLWTRGDFEAAGKDYRIELLEETPLRIRATPRSPEAAKVVAAVELRFSDDRKSLVEVVLEEAVDARTVITFDGIERDGKLPDGLFEIGD